MNLRWKQCVLHTDEAVPAFFNEYFSQNNHTAVLIGGAGFDPRATELARELSSAIEKKRFRGIFIQEKRSRSSASLRDQANGNMNQLKRIVPRHEIEQIDVFERDGAVVGGRRAIEALKRHDLSEEDDIFVDVSALSIGISYPIIRYLLEGYPQKNIHALVASNSDIDRSLRPTFCDAADAIHGFRGGYGLDSSKGSVVLWLPVLAQPQRSALQRIHNKIEYIHDICPIIPFPTRDPRLSDTLAESYIEEFSSAWEVDPRDLIHAAESQPLDVYQRIMRIADQRQRVFEPVGGSLLILSPTANKVLGLGMLMAALDGDFPVFYVEVESYFASSNELQATQNLRFIHVWLAGYIYPN